MERIAVVGLSWRSGGAGALARFALSEDELEERLPPLAEALGARELVYLATCNRVEVAFRAAEPGAIGAARRAVFAALIGRPPQPGEAERALRAWAGEGAAEHLFLVAAGLDSAHVGETEVAGQLQAALARARRAGLGGGRLDEVIGEALKLARKARDQAGLCLGRTSLAEIALELLRERLALAPGTVALVGVSAMTERCGRALAELGVPLLVVNRTEARARELARSLSGAARARSLAAFRAEPEPVAALVSATGAERPLLDAGELSRLAAAAGAERALWVDLGVPPDVDPQEARAAGLLLAGMDDVLARAERTRAERLARSSEARALIDEALAALRRRLGGRTVDALVIALREGYATAVRADLERALGSELAGLDAAQRAALLSLGERLSARFAHIPTKGLRELASRQGPAAIEAFLAGADEALAQGLRAAAERDAVLAALEAAGAGDGEEHA